MSDEKFFKSAHIHDCCVIRELTNEAGTFLDESGCTVGHFTGDFGEFELFFEEYGHKLKEIRIINYDRSFEGVKHLKSLEFLKALGKNKLFDFSQLPSLKKLEVDLAKKTQVESVFLHPGISTLRADHFNGGKEVYENNSITNLNLVSPNVDDFSAFSKFNRLKKIRVDGGRVECLSGLPPSLEDLMFVECRKLLRFGDIAHLKNLESIGMTLHKMDHIPVDFYDLPMVNEFVVVGTYVKFDLKRAISMKSINRIRVRAEGMPDQKTISDYIKEAGRIQEKIELRSDLIDLYLIPRHKT